MTVVGDYMKKMPSKKNKISYLKLFKQSLALSFSLVLFGAQSSYATSITGDSAFNTQVTPDGNITNIQGGIQGSNNTNILHFFDFNLSQGDIANLIFGSNVDRYVGLVDKQIVINGILNAIKNGAIGGDVVFVSPEGMLVGQSGILNMGSLQLITPNVDSYNSVVAKQGAVNVTDISSLRSDNTDPNSIVNIEGKIFSKGAIDISNANSVALGKQSAIVSGFNESGFARTQLGQLDGIVNSDGIVDSQFMTESGGDIKIVSRDVSNSGSTLIKGGLIQSSGDVTIGTTDTANTKIQLTSKVQAGGDVTIGNDTQGGESSATSDVRLYDKINSGGNISIKAESATINKDASLTASNPGGRIDANAIYSLEINSDVTADSGINIDSRVSFNQGADSSFKNLSTGDININSVNLTQDSGASITNEGTGNITITAPGDVSLQKIDAKNGNVEMTTGALTLNDTISAGRNIAMTFRENLQQTSDDFIALNAGNNITVNSTSGNIGSDSQAINMSAKGNVNLGTEGSAYIHGKGENDLTIASGVDLNLLQATSDKGINVTGDIVAAGDINLDAQTGINQAANSNITSVQGDVSFTNTDSGDITTGNINSLGPSSNVTITNNATDGSVKLGGLINSQDGHVTVNSQQNITQTTSNKTIQAADSVDLNAVSGDIGTDEQRVVVSAGGDVTASAGAALNIEGQDTNIDLSKVSAGTDYNLGTTGDGEILINGAFSNDNGSIKLETENTLNIQDNITAAGDITLSSENGVIQTEGTHIESGIGSAQSGDITVTNTGEGGITLNSVTSNKGGITVNNLETGTGNVSVGNLNANGGNITVTSTSSGEAILTGALQSTSDINFMTMNNIVQDENFSGTALNADGSISLITVGNVGSSDNFIKLNAGETINSTGSNIYLESPDSDLKAGLISATNTVNLKTTNTTGSSANDVILTNTVSGTDIDINATGNIYQETEDALTQTIKASGNLTLTAGADIGNYDGEEIKSVVFSAQGELSANAENGSIALNGIDTSIDTSNINAGQNIDLTTTNSGNITVSNPQNVAGHINLNAAENIELNQAISATDDITLNAQGDITQSDELTGTALTSGNNINITAANAGTADKSITVDAQGVVNAGSEDNHAGNIYLEDNTGDFTIGQMFADDNLSLKAQGNIVQADNSVVGITSTGNVTVDSATGNIGAQDSSLKLNIAGGNSSFNVTNSQNVYVESPNSSLNTGNINAVGSVNIATTESGGVNLGGLISANDITIHAIDSIVQNPGNTDKTLETTGNLTLISDNGSIGDSSESGNAVHFSTGENGTLTAQAQQGSVFLNGIDTDINTGTILAKDNIDLTTTNSGTITVSDSLNAEGHITLDSAESLTLNGNLTAGDYIDLAANSGDVNLNHVLTAANDISISASGNISQDASQSGVTINSGANVNLTAGANIGSQQQSVILNADGTVNAQAGSTEVPVPGAVYLTSAGKTINTGVVTATDTVKIDTTGVGNNINLTNKITGKDVVLQTAGSITQNIAQDGPDRSIDASGNLILNAGESIGQTGNAVDFSADGNLRATAVNGSVVLNGIDTDILTDTITAGTDIDLKTTIKDDDSKGNIVVNNVLNTANGYVSLDSAKSLELNQNITAGKYVNLAANGGIIQNDTNIIVAGTNASAQEGYVTVTNNSGGDVVLKNIQSKGDVSVTNSGESQDSGNITLGNIGSDEGVVSVYNNIIGKDIILENKISSAGNITINSKGDITQTAPVISLDSGANIALAGQNIGSSQNNIKLNADGSVSADGTNIYLESTNKDLNISGINQNAQQSDGNISLSATGNGNVHFEGLVKGGNITVTSAQGITQENSLEKAIEASSDLVLTAQNGDIGSSDSSLGGAIDFSAGGTLRADAAGAVVLNGIDTDIITDTINAGTDIDLTTTNSGSITVNNALTTTNGYISLNSAEGLDIAQNINSSDYLKLNAQNGNLNITSDVSADTYADITAQNGNISINANVDSGTYTNINAEKGNIGLASDITAGSYVNVEANGDITQTSGTVTANGSDSNSNGVSVTSNGGNITITSAAANNGSVSINANKIEINHPAVPGDEETPEIPGYTEVIAGDINAGGISAQGSVTIQNDAEDKNVNLTGLVSSTGNIQINSEGNITQSTDDTTLQSGGNVVFDAAGNVGSSTNSVFVNANGTVQADGGDIYLGSKDNNLNIAGINSTDSTADGIVQILTETGDVNIEGLINGGNISVTSAQGITQSGSIAKAIDGQNVSLTANNGSIGAGGNEIDINIRENGKVDASSSDSIYLNSPEGSLTTGEITAQNTVDINSSNTLNMDGLISANDVKLTAVNNITQNSNLEKSIQAGNVSLTSTAGSIGEPAEGETPANAIDFSATGTLEAFANNGSVVLNGVDTSINTSSVTAGDNIDISTTGAGSNITVSNALNAGGYINLNSAEGLIIGHNLTATDYVSLAAQKDILLDSLITAGTDIDINAGTSITQAASNNSIVLNAQNNINLAAGGDIGLSSKSILLNAGNTVGAQGQNIYLSSPNKDLTLSTVTANNNGTVNISTTGAGNLHLAGLVKGGNVSLSSAQNITQDSALNKSIEAQEELVLNAQNGDIGEAQNGDIPANAIDFSAGSVEAHADRGSVVLNGVESDINTGSISAQNNIDLTTTTSGKITVAAPGLSTSNGYININSADDLVLNYDITATNNSVSLGSQNGDITLNSTITAGTDINIDTNGDIIQQTSDTALNAANDINILNAANAGSLENALLVNAGGEVNANGQNIYLEDNTNNFVIGEINAVNDLKLTADGNLLQADSSQTGVTAGGNADLISKTGNIGSSSESINTNVEGLVNAAAQNGSAYLNSTGDFNAGNISVLDNAQITSGSNIVLGGVVNANQINLTAQNNITQTNDGAALQATGGNINLTSTNGNIGTPNGQAIGFTTQGSGTIYASAQNNDGDENGGSVVLKGINSDINTSTIQAHKDIDLTATGTGNITIHDELTAGGYIRIDSATALNIDKNLTAEENIDLIANNGDITLSAVLDAGTDINLESSGSVTQAVNDTVLNAGEDISIIATENIGTDASSILLNAGGNVSASGTNVYLTSPNADFNTGTITATAQNGVVNLNTTGSGSITSNGAISGFDLNIDSAGNVTTNDTVSGDTITIASAQDTNINNNVTAQNGLEISAQNGVEQSEESVISTNSGSLSVTANDGDLNLNGTVSNTNGSVSIVNETTGDSTLTVNNITAGTDFNIRHEGNGILQVTGDVTNNGNSYIQANNEGENSGLAVSGTITNNKGTLTIESKGQQGMQISGDINNNIVDKSENIDSDIIVHNYAGSLSVTGSQVNNGIQNGSQNSISFINDGDGGLDISSDITNSGILSVTNNAGEMSLSGSLNAELGSQNTFTNGSDNDFIINSAITNKGNELNFFNTGRGDLILGENAHITVYSVLDNGNTYIGTLNLKNSGDAGKLQIDGKISGLDGAPAGSILLENTANGSDSGIVFGENASIDAKNNSVAVTNNGTGGIQSTAGVDIVSNSNVNITNTNSGNISFGNDAEISGSSVTIENTASDGGIMFGNDYTISANDGDLTVSNSGANVMVFGDGVNLSGDNVYISNTGSTGGIGFGSNSVLEALQNLVLTNNGNTEISFVDNSNLSANKIAINNQNSDTIFGNTSIIDAASDIDLSQVGNLEFGSGAELTAGNKIDINSTGNVAFGQNAVIDAAGNLDIVSDSGMSFGTESNLEGQNIKLENTSTGSISVGADSKITAAGEISAVNTGSNGGISIGESSSINAESAVTIDNTGSQGIEIANNANITAAQNLTLKNTGSQGITINGTAKGSNVYIQNENSDVKIAHNQETANVIADNLLSVDITNGNLLNSSTSQEATENTGLQAGQNMELSVTGGSIGVLDSTLDSIIQNGFDVDSNNAIHVSAGGTVTVSADNDVNLRTDNENLNIDSLSAKDVLLSAINGSINANKISTENLYMFANGTNGSINVENLTNTGKLSSESNLNTTINSNSALNIDSMLSKNGSIKINSDGNTYINEIAANDDITINVEDEKLTITTLGRVERDPSVVPKTVNLTVKDVNGHGTQYRPGMSYDEINNVGPNSKLDIYHAYVQDKVTMKADTITAQVYDITDGSVSGQKRVDANGKEATGFHNANKNGELLDFDIQGANYSQPDVGSNPHNPNYTPDENDKHALNVHLTIGDSVDGAQFGANFEKLYSDYAFIDTVGSDSEAFSNIKVESGIIGEKAIFRNNKYRVDINNTNISQDYPINKHYDDEPDMSVNNDTSFSLEINDEIKMDVRPGPDIDPDYVEENDPNKRVNVPNMDYLTKEPNPHEDIKNSAVSTDKSTAIKNIGWVVRNAKDDVLGASEPVPGAVLKSLAAISQTGIVLESDKNISKDVIKKGDVLSIQMKKDDIAFTIEGKVSNVHDGLVEVNFINPDKFTKNVMTLWGMEQENL